LANLVSNNIVSVGASLAHVHVPGRILTPDDFNASQDIELGMGIHNEEGFKRLKTDLPGLVKEMLAQLLDTNDKDRAYMNIKSSEPVLLLINNLGGVSVLELGGITEEVCDQLQLTYSLKPERVLGGTFMTSLNGLGFSISILRIVDTGQGSGKSMLELLDAPAEATGWSAAVQPRTWGAEVVDTRKSDIETKEELPSSNLTGSCPPTLYSLRTLLTGEQ
jgi:triose/dihydroxyacetone kinase / FAD-AMP lyase (cyclizing)